MTADTLKTTRVLELYQDFLSGKLINKQQAAEQYHVNVRSIQRDIDSIRDFLSEQCAKEGIVRKIEYDKKENGYRLVTQEIEQLSKGEVLALCKILLESRAFTKEQVEKQLQIILNLCVSQKEKSDIEWFISNELFHYHDPAHATVDSDNLWMVAQAIRNQSVLEIEYQKLKDRQIVKRMVEPVGLMFSEYYFYLMAVITDHSTREAFHKKNDPYPTIYRLDRMHSIKETGEKFSVPYKDRFKEGEYKNRTQFMFGGEPQKISFNYYTSREKLVLSGSIQNDGETVYKNKDIHFSSAIMNCKGTVRFINCAIHYNEDEVSRIFLGDEASLQIESSTVICHGDREKGFFIQSIENSKGLGTCTITNSTFVDNLDFIKGKFDILDFNNNLTQGLYYPLMDIKVKTSAKIRNSRFLSHTPSFAKKYSKSGLDRQDELLYLHNESDYDPAEILIDNDVFVGKEKFDFAHSEEQKEHRMIGKSEEQEELLAIKGPSSKLFRYNKDAMGTVSNCTFTNMGKCVSGMDTVTNCIFDGCSYAVDECCYKVKESRFYNCALACQKLFGQAVVSNCQFVNCKGEELITSGLNAEVKVEDCEFSNIRLVEDGFTYYFRSMIVFGTADSKFANAGRWSEVNRCIFNGICISRKSNRTPKSDEHAYVICAQVTSVDKFKFARARVADCTFTNCASVNSKLINTEPYDSLFGKKHNYMAVSSRNNSGLNDIGDPSSFVASSNVKLKETDANGNKIGSSLSVN